MCSHDSSNLLPKRDCIFVYQEFAFGEHRKAIANDSEETITIWCRLVFPSVLMYFLLHCKSQNFSFEGPVFDVPISCCSFEVCNLRISHEKSGGGGGGCKNLDMEAPVIFGGQDLFTCYFFGGWKTSLLFWV